MSRTALVRQHLLQRPSSLCFAPRQHVWLQCCGPSSTRISSTSTATDTWRVQWALTEHGMDRLGDVTQLRSLANCGHVVQQDEDLLQIDWEGYEWTEADELYHTVWNSVDGVETIAAPLTGRIVRVTNSDESIIDEDAAWVEMDCDDEDVIKAAANWMDEFSYHQWVKTLSPGKFSDDHAA